MRTLSLLMMVVVAGCGPATVPNVSLSGTITLDGTPVKEGLIVFYSETPGGSTVSSKILDGKFEAPVIPQGQYKAAIRSQTVDTATSGPVTSDTAAPKAQEKPDPIPKKYRDPCVPVDANTSNNALTIELKSK